jgi:1-acyl-sn-glycerol-3-phosphate acyltransferase
MKKVVYYTDLLADDFAGTDIKQKKINSDFKFIHSNPLWILAEFVVYRIIAEPLVFVFMKTVFGLKITGRNKLRTYRKNGFFLYGNHTSFFADAFVPSIANFPKKTFILVNPDSVSIPFLCNFVQMLGAVPIPDSFGAMKKFIDAIRRRIDRKKCIMIYPEAHLWPYCTFIRPFVSTSFGYAVNTGAPCFSMTTTYRRRRVIHTPKIVVYIDGPFFPDKSLTAAGQKEQLRSEVYTAMCIRAKNNSYEKIRYEKRQS